MEYLFATNINNTGTNGIVNVETLDVLCLCSEQAAEIILHVLNAPPPSHTEELNMVLSDGITTTEFYGAKTEELSREAGENDIQFELRKRKYEQVKNCDCERCKEILSEILSSREQRYYTEKIYSQSYVDDKVNSLMREIESSIPTQPVTKEGEIHKDFENYSTRPAAVNSGREGEVTAMQSVFDKMNEVSQTGFWTWMFDHKAELLAKEREQIINAYTQGQISVSETVVKYLESKGIKGDLTIPANDTEDGQIYFTNTYKQI